MLEHPLFSEEQHTEVSKHTDTENLIIDRHERGWAERHTVAFLTERERPKCCFQCHDSFRGNSFCSSRTLVCETWGWGGRGSSNEVGHMSNVFIVSCVCIFFITLLHYWFFVVVQRSSKWPAMRERAVSVEFWRASEKLSSPVSTNMSCSFSEVFLSYLLSTNIE